MDAPNVADLPCGPAVGGALAAEGTPDIEGQAPQYAKRDTCTRQSELSPPAYGGDTNAEVDRVRDEESGWLASGASVRVSTDRDGRIVGSSVLTLADLPVPMPDPAGPGNVVTDEQIVSTLSSIGWGVDLAKAARRPGIIETQAWHLETDYARRRREMHEAWLLASGKAHAVVWACGVPEGMMRVVPDWVTRDPAELIADARREAERRRIAQFDGVPPLVVLLGNDLVTEDLEAEVAYLQAHPHVVVILNAER